MGMFEQTFGERKLAEALRLEQRDSAIQEAKNVPLADDPDDLIEGMAQFLSEIGADKAYIDKDEQRLRGAD